MRRSFALPLRSAALLVAVVAPARPASADGPPVNPAMTYLHPGATIATSWKVFSYAGQATDLTPDANGDWVAADGTKLSVSHRTSSSGSGVAVAEVIGVKDDQAWLLNQAFTDMRLLGLPDPLPQGRPATIPATVAQCDLWIDPARLAGLRSDGATHTVVQPIRWTAGARPVDAIRVTTAHDGHLLDHVYDRATGLCVHASSIDTGAAPTSPYVAAGETRAGDTLITVTDLIGVRDQRTPWAGEPMPAWTGRFKVLHYRGSAGINGLDPVVSREPTPLQMDVTRSGSGQGWMAASVSAWAIVRSQPTPPVKSVFVCGSDQFDTFVAGPAALAKLTAGQVLDEDPVTRVRTAVARADGARVTITQASRSLDLTFTFDVATGALVSTTKLDRQTKIFTSLELAGQE